MAIEIMNLPIQNCDFHGYVNVYHRLKLHFSAVSYGFPTILAGKSSILVQISTSDNPPGQVLLAERMVVLQGEPWVLARLRVTSHQLQ